MSWLDRLDWLRRPSLGRSLAVILLLLLPIALLGESGLVKPGLLVTLGEAFAFLLAGIALAALAAFGLAWRLGRRQADG